MLKNRLVFILTTLLLENTNRYQSVLTTCPQSIDFDVRDGVKGYALDNTTFLNFTINHHPECFIKCLENCRCLSFNVCDKQCQLNSERGDMVEKKFKQKRGCVYYNMSDIQFSDSLTKPPCCMNNPCLNAGTCTHPLSSNNKRFRCLCPPGFHGELCGIYMRRSCIDWSTTPISGNYTIYDNNNQTFEVFCDFDSEPNYAWTLVMSFSRDRLLPLRDYGLLEDFPRNENNFNWNEYRLGLLRMNSIRQHSSHWRATCGYNFHGFYEKEYIRVNLSVVDFSKYTYTSSDPSTACQTIEYARLFDAECYNCHIALYHNRHEIPAIYPKGSMQWSGCATDLSAVQYRCSQVDSTYFKHQLSCIDPNSKCQEFEISTTQNWLGGRYN